MLGNVASGTLRRKTTVLSSGVLIDAIVESSGAGPAGSLILIVRSKEYLTSAEVRLLPLLNFSPSRKVQVYVLLPSENSHSSAASGTGVDAPGGKLSRDWKTLLNSSQDPGSYPEAGSVAMMSSDIPTTIVLSESWELQAVNNIAASAPAIRVLGRLVRTFTERSSCSRPAAWGVSPDNRIRSETTANTATVQRCRARPA